ncbi:hypothetical protein ACF0H5_008114 [Mactra antiquata]
MYSVIIENLPDDFKPDLFWPQILVKDGDNKNIKMKDGHLKTEKYVFNKHRPLQHQPIEKWTTPLQVYRDLHKKQQIIVNTIKQYINSTQVGLTYHDGTKDGACQFHNQHIHLIVRIDKANITHVANTYAYKKLRTTLAQHDVHVKSQKINNPSAFGRYMSQNPRQYLGSNDDRIRCLIPDQHDQIQGDNHTTTTTTTTNADNAKKETQLSKNIQTLITIMKRYSTNDKDEIYRLTRGTPDEKDYINIYRSHMFSRIYQSAKEEYTLMKQINTEQYYDWYMRFNPHIYANKTNFLTWEQTQSFLYFWTLEQQINCNDLVRDMHHVLKQTNPKRNTLYFQGASNAGKTYLCKMLIPIDSIAGYHTTSKEFPFGEAVYQPIILINELTIESTAKAELYKNVLGGEPTQVNIKNRPSQIMDRKPVILTTNHHIWKYVTNERQPLMNRCYIYGHLRESQTAKKYSKFGIPNPTFLQDVFKALDANTYEGIMKLKPSTDTDSEEMQTSEIEPLLTMDTGVQATATMTDSETQTTPPSPQRPVYTTCYGCSVDHPSQTQHMDVGGCLYEPPKYTSPSPNVYMPDTSPVTPVASTDVKKQLYQPQCSPITPASMYQPLVEDISPPEEETPDYVLSQLPSVYPQHARYTFTAKKFYPGEERPTPRLNLYNTFMETMEQEDTDLQPPPKKIRYSVPSDEEIIYISSESSSDSDTDSSF